LHAQASLFISIIIPTCNRCKELEELLESLSVQTYPEARFEIVLVDDGSTDETRSLADHFLEARGLPIRYFYQQNQGPGPSRNLGMQKARGDVFVFIDSDCIAPPDWLENIADAMADGSVDAFGGPDQCRPDFPPLLKAIDYSMTSFIGTGGARGTTGIKVAKYYPRSFNMGFRREVYERIGGMGDLRHGQDMEFSNRLHRQGFHIAFLPDIGVYHKRRTSLRRFFKQIFNWGVTRINLGRIDRQMLRPVHALPAFTVAFYALLTLGALLSASALRGWTGITALGFALLCFAGVQSFILHKSIRVALLSMVTLTTQIVAYGLGFWFGVYKSIFSRGDEPIRGFTKEYYQ
jgi:glycosyltransferase involved in cell wall biosynthesis